MKKKKGISPLIATVLLIGFTIILAAVVIKWGGQLVETLKKDTDCASITSLQCAQNIDIKITNVSVQAGGLEIIVDNRGKLNIESFIFRLTFNDGSVYAITEPMPLGAFSAKKIMLESSQLQDTGTGIPFDLTTLTKVEAIASIKTVDTEGNDCVRDCVEKMTSYSV